MASPAYRNAAPVPRHQPRPRPQRRTVEIQNGIEPRGFIKQTPEYDYLATSKKDADGIRRPMLSGLLQSHLIHWIGRRTFGHPDRPEWTTQSARQLAALTGSDSKNVSAALTDLVARRLIACRGETDAPNARKQYRLTPENWRTAPTYRPPVDPDLLRLAKQIEKGWNPKLHQDDESEQERTVKPGTKSKPVTVAVPVKSSEPIGVKIVYHSELADAVSFRASAERNGTLNVTACRPATKPTDAAVMVPIPSRLEANKELSEYAAYLVPFILDYWGTAPDDGLVRKIFDAAAGAPLDTLRDQVALKFKGDRRAAANHKPGLLVNLAQQASRTHQARAALDAQQRKEREATMQTNAPQRPPEPLDMAKRWDRIRQVVQDAIPPESYHNWFAATREISETPDGMIVMARSRAEAAMLTEDYAALLAKICHDIGEPARITFKWEQ